MVCVRIAADILRMALSRPSESVSVRVTETARALHTADEHCWK